MKHDVENDNISGREQDALEEEEEVVDQEWREGGRATGLGMSLPRAEYIVHSWGRAVNETMKW